MTFFVQTAHAAAERLPDTLIALRWTVKVQLQEISAEYTPRQTIFRRTFSSGRTRL